MLVSGRSLMNPPVVPAPFYWTDEAWGPALRCRALDSVAPHLFTTRQLQLSSPDDWASVTHAVGARDAVSLTQVHGNKVVVIRRGQPSLSERPEADVLVSDDSDLAIAIRAADCVPLLLADPKTGAVAAVHAGWRGTVARAAVAALDALHHEFGTNPADVVVAIGPSIGSCCYEVGTELVDAFASAGHARYLVDRWFLARPPARGTAELPKLRLDVAGANRDQLILAGVSEDNVHLSRLCTAEHLEHLTSYRVEKDKAGRLAAVIRSKRLPSEPTPAG
jgi:polyphenol oxidase